MDIFAGEKCKNFSCLCRKIAHRPQSMPQPRRKVKHVAWTLIRASGRLWCTGSGCRAEQRGAEARDAVNLAEPPVLTVRAPSKVHGAFVLCIECKQDKTSITR